MATVGLQKCIQYYSEFVKLPSNLRLITKIEYAGMENGPTPLKTSKRMSPNLILSTIRVCSVDKRGFQYTFAKSNSKVTPCSLTLTTVSSSPASNSIWKFRSSTERYNRNEKKTRTVE